MWIVILDAVIVSIVCSQPYWPSVSWEIVPLLVKTNVPVPPKQTLPTVAPVFTSALTRPTPLRWIVLAVPAKSNELADCVSSFNTVKDFTVSFPSTLTVLPLPEIVT